MPNYIFLLTLAAISTATTLQPLKVLLHVLNTVSFEQLPEQQVQWGLHLSPFSQSYNQLSYTIRHWHHQHHYKLVSCTDHDEQGLCKTANRWRLTFVPAFNALFCILHHVSIFIVSNEFPFTVNISVWSGLWQTISLTYYPLQYSAFFTIIEIVFNKNSRTFWSVKLPK